jgi:hypothetical protein
MRVQVLFKLQGNVRQDLAAEVFVAHCPALGISSQGETEASAQAALADAVLQTFRFQFDRGELDNFLLERGLVADTGTFSRDTPLQHGTYEFEVPLPLAAKKIAL